MMTMIFQMLGGSFLLITLLMLLLFLIYLVHNKADIVDIGWCLGFFIAVWVYFSYGDGLLLRRLLIAGLVTLWALRLTWHLLRRYRERGGEDPRYTAIKAGWVGKISFKMCMLFLLQGTLVVLLSVPFLIICLNSGGFSWWEGAGVAVVALGILGEAAADRQLSRFKQNPNHQAQVCEAGLWGYSRHPNYFFEWVVWIGYFLMAMAAPFGWVAIFSPLIMLYLLLKVSGVPMSEAEALRTRGDAYRDYQSRVSTFIPWFRKSA